MHIATINHYICHFSDSFSDLNTEVSMSEIERLAMVVHGSMENNCRIYHRSKHVFNLCKGMNSRQVLAALFHDVVYYQLDGGFPQQLITMLDSVVYENDAVVVLKPIDDEDTLLQLVASIFNFKSGQTLPLFGGMNEFLSAVVATRLLQPYLQPSDLLYIVACIEATVPFRGTSPSGEDPIMLLAKRVEDQCRKLLNTLSDEHVEQYVNEVMKAAIEIANRDVAGFAEKNPAKFLSDTWELIEESNTPLAAVGVYTVRDYRNALSRMESFLRNLNPETVFHQFRNFPDTEEFLAFEAAARKNLNFSCTYLGTKLVSIAIIEAIAIETGGDCPASMFLGDIYSPDGKSDRIEDFLPAINKKNIYNQELMTVLEKGRSQESHNDLTNSPLTAYVYRCIGDQGVSLSLTESKHFFSGNCSPLDFLKHFDKEMLVSIVDACMKIAISRNDELKKLKHNILNFDPV